MKYLLSVLWLADLCIALQHWFPTKITTALWSPTPLPHPQVSISYTSVSWITLLTLCLLLAGTNRCLLLLQHLLPVSFLTGFGLLTVYHFLPLRNYVSKCLVFQSACCSTCQASAPFLHVLSPSPLFSRLKQSREALGRKRLIASGGLFCHSAPSHLWGRCQLYIHGIIDLPVAAHFASVYKGPCSGSHWNQVGSSV